MTPVIRVVTYADKVVPALRTLRACVEHFGGGSLTTMESVANDFPPNSKKSMSRAKLHGWMTAIANADPGHVLLLVDGFDVLVQRNLTQLYHHFAAIAREHGLSAQSMVAVGGESNCWPWPKPKELRFGYSALYHRHEHISLSLGGSFPADDVCSWFRNRSVDAGDQWPWPNSGVIMGHVTALRELMSCVRFHLDRGHLDDQAIISLCALELPLSQLTRQRQRITRAQHRGTTSGRNTGTSSYRHNGVGTSIDGVSHTLAQQGTLASTLAPRIRIYVDKAARLFLSLHRLKMREWEGTICGSSHFHSSDGLPPAFKLTGVRPFILHFNSPDAKVLLLPRCRRRFSAVCNISISSQGFLSATKAAAPWLRGR